MTELVLGAMYLLTVVLAICVGYREGARRIGDKRWSEGYHEGIQHERWTSAMLP